MIGLRMFSYKFMTNEAAQLLVLLQSVVQTRGLSNEQKSTLLKVLRQSPLPTLREAWGMLAPWQCETLWAIARSGRA
jgi:hypothetical protein